MGVYNIIIFIAACIVSYFIGGISIARIITSKEKEGQISNLGSGNPGTMNMLRTHGLGMGLFTLLCDALKGVVPALFGLLYFGSYDARFGFVALYAFGLCAVLGHMFPIYYKFKGGKGIATTLGVFLVADPLSTVILFVILFVVLYFIKIGSVVSLLLITIEAIIQLFKADMMSNGWAILFMCLMVLLDIIAHRQNLVRLLEHRENSASLQDGLKKDIEKIKSNKDKNLDKNVNSPEDVVGKTNVNQDADSSSIKKNKKVRKVADNQNK